jgi:hypothetical protein
MSGGYVWDADKRSFRDQTVVVGHSSGVVGYSGGVVGHSGSVVGDFHRHRRTFHRHRISEAKPPVIRRYGRFLTALEPVGFSESVRCTELSGLPV